MPCGRRPFDVLFLVFSGSVSERVFRADLRAFHTQNAFRPVFAPAAVVRHIDVHRTDTAALAAVHAQRLVTVDAQKRKIAHRLQKYSHRAKVFAERAVVFHHKRKDYA